MDNSHLKDIFLFITTIFALSCLKKVEGDCLANGLHHIEDADVRFALMLQLRNPIGGECKISDKILQHYLAVEWLIEKINAYDNGTGYIPGLKIGFTSYDDCGQSIYSSRNSVSFLDTSLSHMPSSCGRDSNTVPQIGIIGPGNSESSQTVSSLIKDYPIPIISPMATIAELSNKTLYPTFLRTVPSDEEQISLIVEILDHLEWTYIAVAYESDDYGQSGKRILAEKAKAKGICIADVDLPLPGDDGDLGNQFKSLLETAQGNSLAVVIIAKRAVVENFLYPLDTRIPSTKKRGLHFILLDTVNTDVTVFNDLEQGQGTLTFSIGTGNLNMDDLKEHILEKFSQHASEPDKNPLVKEFLATQSKQLLIPDNVDSFLPATINAVLALVGGLKNLHDVTCKIGDCPLLREKIQSGDLLKRVKDVKVDHSRLLKEIMPATDISIKFSFRFDENGDISIEGSSPLFIIQSFDDRKYKQVGLYSNGKMAINTSQISWLSPEGNRMQGVPNSMCVDESCNTCQNEELIPVTFMEGDVYIVGIFTFHTIDSDNPFKCGQYRNISNDAIAQEGFLLAIEKLRETTGIKFGAIGFDACYSKLRMLTILTNFLSNLSPLSSKMFKKIVPQEKIVGVIGCLSSGCTIPIASFFTPLKVPMVSYASSSPDLDDKIDYPYFLRTVPSDVYQAQVMVNIIKKMGWEYVGLLYVNNNYGSKGMKAFRDIVDREGSGICAAKEVAISDKRTLDDSDLARARRQLIGQNVKVVVFFGIDTRFPHFLKNLEETDYDDFIFIASEDWGINENIKNSAEKASRGSITLKLKAIKVDLEEALKIHLSKKSPTKDDRNAWFLEFWQNDFQCRLKGSFYDKYRSECDTSQRLSEQRIKEGVTDQRTRHVINSVYAIGKGLKEVKDQFCKRGLESCDYLRSNPVGVVEIIKRQTRMEDAEEVDVFDSDGNGAIGFDVYNIQYNVEINTNEYEKVGSFGPRLDDLGVEKLKFYDKYGLELSSYPASCSQDLCNHCKHKNLPNPPPEPVNEENSSPSDSDFRSSDILLISLIVVLILGIAVLVVAFIICFRKKYKNFEKRLETQDIYDYPVRVAYPGSSAPKATNLPFSDPDNSPYAINNVLNREGVSNPTFLSDSDRIESVSQIVGNTGMNIDTPISISSNGNVPSMHHSVWSRAMTNQPASQATRPLSNSSMAPTNLNQMESNFHGSDLQRGNSVIYTSMAAPAMPLNAVALQTQQSSPMNSNNVIIAKGPDGQLVAYTVTANDPTPHNGQTFSTQNSVNPEYGPYSTAAAIALQNKQRQADLAGYDHPTSDPKNIRVAPSPVILSPQQVMYENIELQSLQPGQNILTPHSQVPRESMTLNPNPLNQSYPTQYSIPTQIISYPHAFNTAIPNSHPTEMSQNLQTYPEIASNGQNSKLPVIPQEQEQINHQAQNMWVAASPIATDDIQQDACGAQWEESADRHIQDKMKGEGHNMYGYPDSNSLSSIPDVIAGKMPEYPTTPPQMHRDISLESIDLDTNAEINQEIQFTPQKQVQAKKNVETSGIVNVSSVV